MPRFSELLHLQQLFGEADIGLHLGSVREVEASEQHQAEVDAKFRVEDEDASELKYDVIDR